MTKQRADWYTNPAARSRRVTPEMAQAQIDTWRAERLAEARVQPVSLEGTFISRLVPDPQGTTLVLGFAEQMLQGRMFGVNLISKNPAATAAGDHGTSPFIGRRCRVTVEVLK